MTAPFQNGAAGAARLGNETFDHHGRAGDGFFGKILECVFQKDGFKLERTESSHRVYSKPGCARPVIIPVYDEIDVEIIKRNMRTAGMSRERYFMLLAECKG